jgi:hypothetical protein
MRHGCRRLVGLVIGEDPARLRGATPSFDRDCKPAASNLPSPEELAAIDVLALLAEARELIGAH